MTRLRKGKAAGSASPIRSYFVAGTLRSDGASESQSGQVPGSGEARKRQRESGTIEPGRRENPAAQPRAPGSEPRTRDRRAAGGSACDPTKIVRGGMAAVRGSPAKGGGSQPVRSPLADQRATPQARGSAVSTGGMRNGAQGEKKKEGKKYGEEKQRQAEKMEERGKKEDPTAVNKSSDEGANNGMDNSAEEHNSSGSGLDTSNEGPPSKKTCPLDPPNTQPTAEPITMDTEYPPLPSVPLKDAANNADKKWPGAPSSSPAGTGQSPLSKKDLELVMDKYMTKMEEMLKGELKSVRESIEAVLSKVEKLEDSHKNLDKKIQSNSDHISKMHQYMIELASQVEDQENRGRRNNLRIRGVPESIDQKELKATVLAVLNEYLGRPPKETLEIDRAHRALGPIVHNRPRDIICCMHYYTMKERILKNAWERGTLKINGMEVIILQDLGRKTLKMRRFLKPLLELITQKGGSYRWGYPFYLIIRKENKTFVMRSPTQVQEACDFLGSPPIKIPNWQEVLLNFNYVPDH